MIKNTFLPTVTIQPFSLESTGGFLASGSLSANTWPSANRALFVPFRVQSRITVTKAFWVNGGAVSGNVDIGIYSEGGARLVSSGSIAQANINLYQEVDITDTQLGTGLFFMALAVDNGTAQFVRRTTSTIFLTPSRVYQMASAFVLPATATFATVSSSYLPVFGVRI